MFPIDAAVIPLPSEETTPPVTKTYFDIETSRAVFQILPGRTPRQTYPRKWELTPHSPTFSPEGRGGYGFGSALGSSRTSLVSYSPDDACTESLGCGSPAVRPISFRNRSIGSSSSLMPGIE